MTNSLWLHSPVFSLAARLPLPLDSRQSMCPLKSILAQYRATSQSEREKGSYFEEIIYRD